MMVAMALQKMCIRDRSANRGTVEAGLSAKDQNLRKETVQTSLLRFRNGVWKDTGAEMENGDKPENEVKTEASLETD